MNTWHIVVRWSLATMFYQFSVYHMTVLGVGVFTDQIAKESTSQMFSSNCFWENDVKNMQLCNSMAQMSLSSYTVFGIMDMELCIDKHVMIIK